VVLASTTLLVRRHVKCQQRVRQGLKDADLVQEPPADGQAHVVLIVQREAGDHDALRLALLLARGQGHFLEPSVELGRR